MDDELRAAVKRSREMIEIIVRKLPQWRSWFPNDRRAAQQAERELPVDEERRKRIPASLQSLAWRQWSDDTPVESGDTLLVAVPVCDDASRNDRWHYECEVVTVNCDDADGGEYFELSGSDFSPCEVEFFVRIK